jgi:hypothetical protein
MRHRVMDLHKAGFQCSKKPSRFLELSPLLVIQFPLTTEKNTPEHAHGLGIDEFPSKGLGADRLE